MSMFPCLPLIIVESDREQNWGGASTEEEQAYSPALTKNDEDSNMNTRKRETNRAKTAAKANTNTKTGVGGK